MTDLTTGPRNDRKAYADEQARRQVAIDLAAAGLVKTPEEAAPLLHDTASECRLETGPECRRLRSAFHVGPTCACAGACALAASCCP